VEGADLVELRLDLVDRPDVAAALAGRRCRAVVTCRAPWEGGRFQGSEEERRRVLAAAIDSDAEYVDLEWRGGFDDLIARRGGHGVVLSWHHDGPPPPDLGDRYRAMRGAGADVVKVATAATRLSHMLPLLDLGRTLGSGERTVLLATGPAGLAARLLAAKFRSCWTYAGDLAPLGQVSARRMRDEFGWGGYSRAADVYGVVGRPLDHSVSPAMLNAGMRAAHVDAVCVPCPAADVDDFVAFARAIGMKGAGVTAPFKRDLLEYVGEVDAATRRAGALNALRIEDGRWEGTNTDILGFLEPLLERFDTAQARAAILGAGGAARGVAIALASTGAHVTVYARDRARAAEVAMLVDGEARPLPPPPGSWDLLVNATTAGTLPDSGASPIPGVPLDGRLVYDLVYDPPQTRLLADAQAAGCATIGGLEMLVAQARLQFKWWFGARPPQEVFREAALKRLAELHAQRTAA
jgi:3-dehydroquinate dehydratase/shikimate dehydrogenase